MSYKNRPLNEQRARLDDLLGRNRNTSISRLEDWSDSKVCKYFLCGLCPKDLLSGTKGSIGTCTLIHNDLIREQYRKCPKFRKCGFEEKYIDLLEDLIDEANERYVMNRKRLGQQTNEKNDSKASIEEGDEKETEISNIENLNVELDKKQQQQAAIKNHNVELCEICGSFVMMSDESARPLEAHIGGRLHIGMLEIRKAVKEFFIKNPQYKPRTEINTKKVNLATPTQSSSRYGDFQDHYSPHQRSKNTNNDNSLNKHFGENFSEMSRKRPRDWNGRYDEGGNSSRYPYHNRQRRDSFEKYGDRGRDYNFTGSSLSPNTKSIRVMSEKLRKNDRDSKSVIDDKYNDYYSEIGGKDNSRHRSESDIYSRLYSARTTYNQ